MQVLVLLIRIFLVSILLLYSWVSTAKTVQCPYVTDSDFPSHIIGTGEGRAVDEAHSSAIANFGLKFSSHAFIRLTTRSDEKNVSIEENVETSSAAPISGLETLRTCSRGESFYVVVGRSKHLFYQEILRRAAEREKILKMANSEKRLMEIELIRLERAQKKDRALWLLIGRSLETFPGSEMSTSQHIKSSEKPLSVGIDPEVPAESQKIADKTFHLARTLAVYVVNTELSHVWSCALSAYSEFSGTQRFSVHCSLRNRLEVVYELDVEGISRASDTEAVAVNAVTDQMSGDLRRYRSLYPNNPY